MSQAPPLRVQGAFVAPTAQIVRRIEIHQFDGKTPWRPELWDWILVGGSITADMTRDERRTIDIELDNADGYLDPVAGGFWYDKVIKAFYGIELPPGGHEPKVIIVEEYQCPGQALALKSLLAAAGVHSAFYNPLVSTYDEVRDYDVLVSISSSYTRKLALLTDAFAHGKSILTVSPSSTAASLPYLVGGSGSAVADPGIRTFEKQPVELPAALGWSGVFRLAGPQSYTKIAAVTSGTSVLAKTYDATNGFSPGVLYRRDNGGQGWAHVVAADVTASAFDYGFGDFTALISSLVASLDYGDVGDYWETQIGEFVADSIEDSDDFSERIKFTGRDYAKRCLGAKLTKATTFTKDQRVEDVIRTLALNSKVSKLDLPLTGKVLGKDMTYERDTDRWKIIKDVALANNYEVFFTATGYLTLRPQQDPLTSPPGLVLATGVGGNLIKRGAKTGDSELFNHVTVVGESSDTAASLAFGEAINNAPNSPSSVDAIGERTKNISSPLVTSDAQAQELANTMLSVSSLEEFELNFTSVLLPWAEPGDVLEMGEPGSYWGPTRYLLSSLSLPLDLGPMSGTGKRVTKVN